MYQYVCKNGHKSYSAAPLAYLRDPNCPACEEPISKVEKKEKE